MFHKTRIRDRKTMNIDRRRFVGAAFAGAAAMASSRVFAMPRPASDAARMPQALAALDRHGSSIAQRDMIGIVDFARHSSEPRFQLVDVASGRVTATWLVAHGRGSDPANSGWASRFSNQPGSYASSDGSYVTGDIYRGKHGSSRRLHGLDPQNSMAFERAIVIHGAHYVDSGLALSQGRIGRSEGCFAVQECDIAQVLDRLGPGRLLFAARSFV
jgi:hypothetical protein